MPIGYQAKTTGTERVTLVSDPGYWVEILTELERGALKEAEAALAKASVAADGEGNTATSLDPDVARYRDLMVRYSIVAWNLDGPDGRVLEVNPVNVDLLKGRDFDKIYNRIEALNKDMSDDDRKRFPGQGELSDRDGDGARAGQPE